jgi:molybdenum cofactor cytidylyltransferase
METWAIILAAGESRRMRKNKLLLPFHKKTLIEIVVKHAMQAGIDNILLVLGAYRDDLLPVIRRMPVRHCYNKDYKKGMLSSVQCGFRNIPPSMEAAIIFLGDQPAIPGEVTQALIKDYRQSERGIVIPVYRGKRGHPVLIHKRYRKDIDVLDQAEGLHGLMRKFSHDILEVEVDSPGILKDIDVPQDYLELTKSK